MCMKYIKFYNKQRSCSWFVLLYGIESQEHAGNWPGLGLAGEVVHIAIFVCELGQAAPIIAV